ncbi:hypothetical protein [Terribacillus halophilus]|uniref:hypothetical protein n=1 Tax=Terribacillus halophilus TaxID=361279 RepID=UPI00111458AD|nr:hypothetical protein [Terribacillus halophilus]
MDITETSNMHEHPELITGMLQDKEKLRNQMAHLQTVLDFIDQKIIGRTMAGAKRIASVLQDDNAWYG